LAAAGGEDWQIRSPFAAGILGIICCGLWNSEKKGGELWKKLEDFLGGTGDSDDSRSRAGDGELFVRPAGCF
jgi:hypothetical protein